MIENVFLTSLLFFVFSLFLYKVIKVIGIDIHEVPLSLKLAVIFPFYGGSAGIFISALMWIWS